MEASGGDHSGGDSGDSGRDSGDSGGDSRDSGDSGGDSGDSGGFRRFRRIPEIQFHTVTLPKAS